MGGFSTLYRTSENINRLYKVPYPLISTVVRLPLSLHGQSPIAFRSRTFEYFTLTFTRDRDALDVFESIKELTVACEHCRRNRRAPQYSSPELQRPSPASMPSSISRHLPIKSMMDGPFILFEMNLQEWA